MTRDQAREAARELLEIMPLVMRTVAAELRFSGELPAPAHFPLLMMLDEQPRTLTELAVLRGVSPPTMSNSITALVQRGWARRSAPGQGSPRRHHRGHQRGPSRPGAGREMRRGPPRRGRWRRSMPRPAGASRAGWRC